MCLLRKDRGIPLNKRMHQANLPMFFYDLTFVLSAKQRAGSLFLKLVVQRDKVVELMLSVYKAGTSTSHPPFCLNFLFLAHELGLAKQWLGKYHFGFCAFSPG